jgi:hypothetical protein
MVEVRISYKALVGELAGRDNFEERGVNGRAVLILVLDQQGGKFWIGIGLEEGCCENCYETLILRNNCAETRTFL